MFVSIVAHAEQLGPGVGYLILLTASGLVFLAMNLLSLGEHDGGGADLPDGLDAPDVLDIADVADVADVSDIADAPDSGDVDFEEGGEIEAGTRSIFHYLSFRNCLNYLIGFGAGGYLATLSGAHPGVAALCALTGGGVCALLLYKFMALLYSLGDAQPLRMSDAIGATARVYIAIGPKRSRQGKILVLLKSGQRECLAVTDHHAELPRQRQVRIVKAEGGTFVVEPLSE